MRIGIFCTLMISTLAYADADPKLGIDESAMNRTVDPCDDFYEYACGSWIKNTQIPADRPAWIRSFSEIDDRNLKKLNEILEGLTKSGGAGTPYGDKLSAFYGSCMDEAGVETAALPQLKEELRKVDAVKSIGELAKELAHLHLGVTNAMFGFSSQQDFKDATLVIGGLDQGGIGLPDRDYYLKEEPNFKMLREKYLAHIAKMLELSGESTADAKTHADTVMKIEHALAEASMSRVDRRDPKKLYHRLDLDGILKETPKFPWKSYFAAMGIPLVKQINVAVPGFFKALNNALQKTPLTDWRTYLRWQVVHGAAPALSKAFVDENFAFYGKTLEGTDKLLPRWKRCVQATDHLLGEALARPFVRDTFGVEGKHETREMVMTVELNMLKNLTNLSWMDDATRLEALRKLGGIGNKIGYPDRWRNYDKLELKPGAYLTNIVRASEFESHRDLEKIGKPLDRSEWGMTPPTVNAYYDPSMNEMVFPAGILQPPFYTREGNDAANYGAVGMVMGHELTHGFDDEGRQFDAQGNLRDWWTPSVSKDFDHRAECVEKQYSSYTAVGDVHVNGKLTLGENIADLGGVKLAYTAFKGSHPVAPGIAVKAGKLTDDQIFFLGFAQGWCAKRRDEYSRKRAATDPHSPPEHRVNGPLSNLPEFARAFQCKAGKKMVRAAADQCVVW